MSEYISFGSHRNLFLYSQWIRRHLNKLHGNLGILSLISTASQQKKIKMSYPWPHLGIIKVFITEIYLLNYDICLIERSRRTSNPAGRSSRISNSAGHLLCVTWFEPGRDVLRSEDSEPFVWGTSRIIRRAYERILTFGTAQSNTPIVCIRTIPIFGIEFDYHFFDQWNIFQVSVSGYTQARTPWLRQCLLVMKIG